MKEHTFQTIVAIAGFTIVATLAISEGCDAEIVVATIAAMGGTAANEVRYRTTGE